MKYEIRQRTHKPEPDDTQDEVDAAQAEQPNAIYADGNLVAVVEEGMDEAVRFLVSEANQWRSAAEAAASGVEVIPVPVDGDLTDVEIITPKRPEPEA